MKSQQDLVIGHSPIAAVADDTLTPEEKERLEAFLSRRHNQPHYAEWEINPQRMEFARWLVQRGALSEDVHDSLDQR